MSLDSFMAVSASMEKPKSNGNKFAGERIPFLTIPVGKTRLHPISDLHDDENQTVPPVKMYRYYRLPEPVALQDQRYKSFEVAWEKGDEFEPGYVEAQKNANKKINPDNFPWKGFMYVENLTALKAVQLHLEGKNITSKEFSRDPHEAAAAKAYVQQYLKSKEEHENRREELLNDKDEPKDIGEFNYHGIFIYNFPVTITRKLAAFVRDFVEEGESPDDIHLTDYVFALTKEGEGKNTSYGFSIDYHISDLDESIVAPAREFLESKELSDFKGLLDRKRYKTDELEEEVKISTMSAEDVDEPVRSNNW